MPINNYLMNLIDMSFKKPSFGLSMWTERNRSNFRGHGLSVENSPLSRSSTIEKSIHSKSLKNLSSETPCLHKILIKNPFEVKISVHLKEAMPSVYEKLLASEGSINFGDDITGFYDKEYHVIRFYCGESYHVVNLWLNQDNVVSKISDTHGWLSMLGSKGVLSPGFLEKVGISSDDIKQASQELIKLEQEHNLTFQSYLQCALTNSSLIAPGNLKGLILNKDYVLLQHSASGGLKNILKEGIRSLEGMYSQENASDEVKKRYELRKEICSKGISNDPGLIYFRPVSQKRPIFNDGIVIAIKPQNAFVYEQENRADGTYSSYINSKIPIIDYINLENSEGPNYSGHHVNTYIPEVCIRVNHIKPEFFLTLINDSSHQ